MGSLLVFLLVFLLVLVVANAIIDQLALPPNIKNVTRLVLAIIGLLILLERFGFLSRI